MARRLTINQSWLRRISTQVISGNRAKVSSEAKQSAKIGEGRELYNPKVLKKNYGIIPLLAIVIVGIVGLSGFIFRNALTRDDIRFRTNSKFGYEQEENLDKKRKFLTYNQQYKSPEGLKELYEELKEK